MLQVRLRGRQAVLRDVRAEAGARQGARATATSTSTIWIFYTLTTTCCQIDLIKLFHGGFSTGHGYLREPNDIARYSALACIAIQSNQNDQHGGQSIVEL